MLFSAGARSSAATCHASRADWLQPRARVSPRAHARARFAAARCWRGATRFVRVSVVGPARLTQSVDAATDGAKLVVCSRCSVFCHIQNEFLKPDWLVSVFCVRLRSLSDFYAKLRGIWPKFKGFDCRNLGLDSKLFLFYFILFFCCSFKFCGLFWAWFIPWGPF